MEGENRYEQQRPSHSNSKGKVEIKPDPNPKCPRCDSMKTRFCYFNNHKTSQPRYICKNCNRFWTQGGRRIKGGRDSSSSGGSAKDSPSTTSSLSPPLVTMVPACGSVPRFGTLNFTRPPVANEPPLKFVRVDINDLSLTQRFNRVLNPYMISP